ncbi:MAG: hypothetical protein LKE54_07555 [Prevotella sp.]|jgi:hypothetical protein|nr:hypothetical protein [Prevotella sp.]MCH3994889.1 hypothetical protein [Prevotella sp.]
MGTIIFAIIICAIAGLAFGSHSKNKSSLNGTYGNRRKIAAYDPDDSDDSDIDDVDVIEDDDKEPEYGGRIDANGNEYFKIAGINYRDLDDSILGDFTGCIVIDYDNKSDPHAIAVYSSDNQHLGFAPRGSELLYNKLIYDGKTAIHGFIKKAYDDDEEKEFYYGYFYLDE